MASQDSIPKDVTSKELDYEKQGLNEFLQPLEAPISQHRDELATVFFEETIERGDLMSSKIFGLPKEAHIQATPQWTDIWTELDSYQDATGSLIEINFNDWPDHTFYFEVVGKVDAGTGYWRLYNITDSVAMSESEMSSTSTTAVRLRSSEITKPYGTKEFKVQHYIDGGNGTTDFVNTIMSRIIFSIDNA